MEATKQNKSKLILGLVAILFLAFFIYLNNKYKQFDWRFTLDDESKEPYGTTVVKDILQNSIAVDNFKVLDKKLAESLPEGYEGDKNFIFIGEALLIDSLDTEQLLDFVNNGNTAFISSVTIPDLLMDQVFISPCDTLYWEDYFTYYDTAVITNFKHPDLQETTDFSFPWVYKNKIYNNYWAGMIDHVFCDSADYPVVISQSPDSMVTMAMLPYGEGAFYLQTAPIAFTNFHLLRKEGQKHAAKAFSHLANGTIYWDDFSNVPAAIGRGKNWANHDPLKPKEGPLDYILSQPPLAWAWYSLLAMGLLYLLFRAKRRQRMIPVLEANRNTSLEFISTIGRMHFTGTNHKRIALQKMDLLQSFIRSKYRISNKEMDDNFVHQLSTASEIDESLLKKMFLLYTNIKSSAFTSDKTLIELHKLTDYFYKNCR